jgi:hypothetical protein
MIFIEPDRHPAVAQRFDQAAHIRLVRRAGDMNTSHDSNFGSLFAAGFFPFSEKEISPTASPECRGENICRLARHL